MKKTLSIILAAVMVLGMLVVVPAVGSATEATQAKAVSTEAEFLAMDPAGFYFLDEDITLTKTYGLGDTITAFTGTLIGNDHKVTITNNAMFAQVKDATIKNLTVEGNLNPTETGIAVGNQDYFAAVAVIADGASTFRNIISNVNFTTTLANTRWGAIAAYSYAGHALLIENCVSNGTVDSVNYAGGVYGWSSKQGDSVIKNCVNNGDITLSNGYGAGIVCRLTGDGTGGSIVVENCINNGNITVHHDQGAGIVAYARCPKMVVSGCINNGDILNTKKHAAGILGATGNPGSDFELLITGNVNNGNVTSHGNNYVGGIVANIGNPSQYGAYNINYNINNGDITGNGNDTGGIVGYAWAGNSPKPNQRPVFLTAIGNVNTGTIKNTKWASQLICYTNNKNTVIKNNIGIGKVVLAGDTEPAEGDGQRVFVGSSSANAGSYNISDNYYIKDDGTVYFGYSAATVGNRILFADRKAGTVNIIEESQIAETVETVNAALGSTVFTFSEGKISNICSHDYFIENGVCSACGTVLPFTGESFPTVTVTVVTMFVSFVGIVGVAIYFKKKKRIAE